MRNRTGPGSLTLMTSTTPRPADATDCPECSGDGLEWDVVEGDETDPETGAAVELRVPYGPCQICDGRGWFPRETRAQRRAREDRERAESQARRFAAHNEKWAAEGREHNDDCPWAACAARGH